MENNDEITSLPFFSSSTPLNNNGRNRPFVTTSRNSGNASAFLPPNAFPPLSPSTTALQSERNSNCAFQIVVSCPAAVPVVNTCVLYAPCAYCIVDLHTFACAFVHSYTVYSHSYMCISACAIIHARAYVPMRAWPSCDFGTRVSNSLSTQE